jgi:hypothetical protein
MHVVFNSWWCMVYVLKSINFWQACDLLACWFLAELFSSTLNMETICSSETSVDTQWTTRRYIPEVVTLHNHRCENLKSYTVYVLFENVLSSRDYRL